MEKSSLLSNKQLIVVFAYAPAGFGHLRVTGALYHGLPKEVTPVLLGSQDKSITYIHRLMSTHPVIRFVTEWMQRGFPQYVFTSIYRSYLRNNTTILYEQLLTIVDQRIDVPKVVLVVATHFGLAHKLARIKKKIEEKRKIKVILVVQVTDDSPQYVWYVQGADLIFVPSEKTRRELLAYGKKAGLEKVDFEVNAYPITPYLSDPFTKEEFEKREKQTDYKSDALVHVAIPVSGAAVGMSFFQTLITALHSKSHRFLFHVIAKNTPNTSRFLDAISHLKYVDVHSFSHDREVVDKYEQMYRSEIITLEVTKPSEQAFKALLEPTQKGGVILLFSEAVGRQEDDNIDFLRRHLLVPSAMEQERLWSQAFDEKADEIERAKILKRAQYWRGVLLPANPQKAADFILWCMKKGMFRSMTRHNREREKSNLHNDEINPEGVLLFWEKVSKLIEKCI